MLHRTPRHSDRDIQARRRLERMMHEAQAAAAVPADPERTDESPAPRGDPWWLRGRAGQLVERWVPGGSPATTRRRLPLALLIGVTLGAAVALGIALSSSDGREPRSHLPAAVDSSAPPSSSSSGGQMVISIVGRVARPGLVTLPDGARVADAVEAAGGPAPGADLGALNMARRLTDGEQLYVGIPPPPDAAPPAPGAPAKIDLNSASAAQLDTLPGVGTVTAQRIVDWRTTHGRFARIDQLREVDGIGPARFAQLKDLVVVR